jgi:hypothetical protein
MITAVILHNMIIKDERNTLFQNNHDYHQANSSEESASTASSQSDLDTFLMRYQAICNRSTHHMLKEDLIEHLWNLCGQSHDDRQESD